VPAEVRAAAARRALIGRPARPAYHRRVSATPFPNQPSPFADVNLFDLDVALREAVAHGRAMWAREALSSWGATLGAAQTYALADAANAHAPELRTYDRSGTRIDDITFHPAWDALMQLAMARGEHCSAWRSPQPAAEAARAASCYLHAQVENGTQCPLTMTYASVPVLRRHAPHEAETWLSRIFDDRYDPRSLPVAQKRSALLGMGMTERQGGSDVRANLTRAAPDAGGAWRITGHKWFFSAPQSDAHLILAQTDGGLSCFLMPRIVPDGRRNNIRVNRLKDKLGNRSNASAEVEFDGALAWPVGAPGRGIATILEMVQHTRLDCVVASAGTIRAALTAALHHARSRVTFGRALVLHPLMANVLADLALESEASLQLAMMLARAGESDANDAQRAVARLVAPAAKYWVCKRAVMATAEAMEVLGGNGYVEENVLPRLYREAPVNSIWEGSGNVVCLDIRRALRREPEAAVALLDRLADARGANRRYDDAVGRLGSLLRDAAHDEAPARRVAQAIALTVSGAQMIECAPPAVADAYCASRFDDDTFGGAAFGTLPDVTRAPLILDRALS
ncbi:MAG: isovaleryl-CoA dehydrogenase, partial [Betaproteobacteria bacterium]